MEIGTPSAEQAPGEHKRLRFILWVAVGTALFNLFFFGAGGMIILGLIVGAFDGMLLSFIFHPLKAKKVPSDTDGNL